ncbi:MAG: FMN-binding protein [Spirochaetota bacterium]
MNTESRLYGIVFTFVYTFVFMVFLTVVYLFARDKIELNEQLFRQKALLNAMGIEYTTDTDAAKKYEEMISREDVDDTTLYTATVDETNVNLITFAGQGLWGTIHGALSVNDEVTRIIGLDIISHSETPGLGGRIAEEWFLRQFRGEKIENGSITFTQGDGNYQNDDAEVDAITGATRTSEALEDMINKALSTLQELEQEGEL